VLGKSEQNSISVMNRKHCANDGVQSMTKTCDNKSNKHEERYSCEKCSFSSVYARTLTRHLNNEHRIYRSAIAIYKQSFSLQSH